MATPDYEVETVEFSKLRDLVWIGAGGFGDVYCARHNDWGPVAFKKLPVTFVNPDDRAAIELRREVAVHSRLRHSNVIQLMAVVFEYGHYGVLLEYATHADLRHFIRRFTPVPWEWKLYIANGIAVGMNYLHTATKRPLIHADLKMKNVLVSEGFKPKISDFGLSRWKRYSYEMTRREHPGGTVTHIPPENWRDINTWPTEKYDVYSFGILLWELLSENYPFCRVVTNAIKDSVLRGERPPMDSISVEVPDCLKKIIEHCWAQNPLHRPLFSELKPQFEHLVEEHNYAIQSSKHDLQQREMSLPPAAQAVHLPSADVRTGGRPVAVVDPGSRVLWPTTHPGLNVAGQSQCVNQPGVILPLDSVRTNQDLGDLQPTDSDFSSGDSTAAAVFQTTVALHPSIPDESLRSDRSVGLQIQQMELSSREMREDSAAGQHSSQTSPDEAMDQCVILRC